MTISKQDIERGFYVGIVKALRANNTTALELARQHPKLSIIGLAEKLGHGATARGFTMKLFEESRQLNCIEQTAKSLLYRKILQEYPEGWYDDEKLSTTVKLGKWYSDISEFVPEYENAAMAIVRDFASAPPDVGWRPESEDDERLRLTFERHWKKND